MTEAIAAFIGAIIVFITTMITRIIDIKQENNKWKREHEKESQQLKKIKISEAGKMLLSLHHTINWYCWFATKTPQRFSIEDVKLFNKEVHILWPQVQSKMIEIAVYNQDAYNELFPIFKQLVSFDAEFTEVVYANFEDEFLTIDASKKLEKILNRIVNYSGTITTQVVKALSKM